jgi:hypothetical protein
MKLIAFSIRNHALAGETLPERIKLLSWGDNPSVNKVSPRVTSRTFAVLPATQAEQAWDRPALDYEHNTVKGSPAYLESTEPRDVAAYGVPEVVEGDGLYLTNLIYTPNGRAHAANYIDLSPTVLLDEQTSEVLGLHSVGLTRTGAIEGVHYFNVADGTTPRGTNPDTGGDAMDMEAMGKELASLREMLDKLQEKIDANAAPVETFSSKLTTIEGALATFRAEVAGQIAERDKQAILQQAASEGKHVALKPEVLAKFSVDELAAHVAEIKPTVPLRRFTPDRAPLAEGATVLEQYNDIEDPRARAAFYKANKDKL